jgi:hypothetical protein
MFTAFAIFLGGIACLNVRGVWGDAHAIGLAAGLVGVVTLAPAGTLLAVVAAAGVLAHARTQGQRLSG